MTIGYIGDATVQTAPCPSLEQLQGIVDPTDPCQAALTAGDVSAQNIGAVAVPGLSMALLIPVGLLLVFAVMGARK